MSQENQHQTLIEKYQVKNFDDLKLPARIKQIITDNQNTYYRLLLYSSPGTGKTTTAKLLSKGKSVLYLSGSNDFNIQTMRKYVYPFCNSFSVNDKEKVLIIDEADNIPNKIQDAFKILIDTAKKVRFIFITNEIDKINDAIQSRCTKLNYNYTASELDEQQANYLKFMVDVVQKENIGFTKEGLLELLKYYFPDFRALLDILQVFKTTKQRITVENISKNKIVSGIQNKEIYDLIEHPENYNARKFYEIVSKYRGIEESVLTSLCEPYFQYLNDKGLYEKTLETAEIMNEFTSQYNTTINKFGLLVACIYKLRKNYLK